MPPYRCGDTVTPSHDPTSFAMRDAASAVRGAINLLTHAIMAHLIVLWNIR
jgi:hypothetical protein